MDRATSGGTSFPRAGPDRAGKASGRRRGSPACRAIAIHSASGAGPTTGAIPLKERDIRGALNPWQHLITLCRGGMSQPSGAIREMRSHVELAAHAGPSRERRPVPAGVARVHWRLRRSTIRDQAGGRDCGRRALIPLRSKARSDAPAKAPADYGRLVPSRSGLSPCCRIESRTARTTCSAMQR